MRRFAALLAIAAAAAACGPTNGAAPGGAAASKAPTAGSSAKPTEVPVVATPTPVPSVAAVPVTLKVLIDGKPANIEPLAYIGSVVITANSSFFWSIGAIAKQGDANIGQGYGLLKEGEGNITLHMKYANSNGLAALKTMTDAEFKGGTGMTYKEGPKNMTWHAGGNAATSGSFTVEGDAITFKMVAEIPGSKENTGAARKFDIEVSGLPKPLK